MQIKGLPGAVYLNGRRYWWKVKLPGREAVERFPLRPVGAIYATSNETVAIELAKEIYRLEAAKHKCLDHRAGYNGTIAALCRDYLVYAEGYYRRGDGRPSREIKNVKLVLEPFDDLYGGEMAEEFGPTKLKQFRQSMIDDKSRRRPYCRNTINQRIGIVRRMFRWGVSEELVPSHVIHALDAVEGLKYGRSSARESDPVTPVAAAHVLATLPYATPVVRAMIMVHLYTGMRTGEIVAMRTGEIDMTGDIWLYRPTWHKTKHHGHDRVITMGPKAQELLRPYLKKDLGEFCFSFRESAESRIREKYGKCYPQPTLDKFFTRQAYANSVQQAIRAARKAGVDIPDWSPNQLRHTAATLIRKQFGLDAAAAVLGHAQVSTTEIYAEIDMALAAKAAKAIG